MGRTEEVSAAIADETEITAIEEAGIIAQSKSAEADDNPADRRLPLIARIYGIVMLVEGVVTLPIIAIVFGKISIISLLANVLVLPLIPLTMLMTFVTGLVGFVVPALQFIVAWPTQRVLELIVRAIEWCASLPYAQIEWQAGVAAVIIMYALVILGCVYMRYRAHYQLHTASVVD